MKARDLRRLLCYLPDDADVRLHLASNASPDTSLDVKIETVAPSQDKTRLDIHVSIVQSPIDNPASEIAYLQVVGADRGGKDRYFVATFQVLRLSIDTVAADDRYQWLLDHTDPVEVLDPGAPVIVIAEDSMGEQYEEDVWEILNN